MKALKYMAGVILAALALSSCQKELDIPQNLSFSNFCTNNS